MLRSECLRSRHNTHPPPVSMQASVPESGPVSSELISETGPGVHGRRDTPLPLLPDYASVLPAWPDEHPGLRASVV